MEEASKSNLKRISLELGGKSPLVIMDDFNGTYYFLVIWHPISQSLRLAS